MSGKIEKNAAFFENHNSVQRESIILRPAPFKFPVALEVPRKPQKVQRLCLAWKNTQKFGFSFIPDPYSMLHPSWSLTEVTLIKCTIGAMCRHGTSKCIAGLGLRHAELFY